MPTRTLLEADLETTFAIDVRRHGGLTFKLAPIRAGFPDRLVISPAGRIYLVELKTEAGELSPIQQHVHIQLAANHVTVHIVYGPDEAAQWVRDYVR